MNDVRVSRELFPCAHCGSKNLNEFTWTTFNEGYDHSVEMTQCLTCDSQAPTAVWNTRTEQALAPEKAEQVGRDVGPFEKRLGERSEPGATTRPEAQAVAGELMTVKQADAVLSPYLCNLKGNLPGEVKLAITTLQDALQPRGEVCWVILDKDESLPLEARFMGAERCKQDAHDKINELLGDGLDDWKDAVVRPAYLHPANDEAVRLLKRMVKIQKQPAHKADSLRKARQYAALASDVEKFIATHKQEGKDND